MDREFNKHEYYAHGTSKERFLGNAESAGIKVEGLKQKEGRATVSSDFAWVLERWALGIASYGSKRSADFPQVVERLVREGVITKAATEAETQKVAQEYLTSPEGREKEGVLLILKPSKAVVSYATQSYLDKEISPEGNTRYVGYVRKWVSGKKQMGLYNPSKEGVRERRRQLDQQDKDKRTVEKIEPEVDAIKMGEINLPAEDVVAAIPYSLRLHEIFSDLKSRLQSGTEISLKESQSNLENFFSESKNTNKFYKFNVNDVASLSFNMVRGTVEAELQANVREIQYALLKLQGKNIVNFRRDAGEISKEEIVRRIQSLVTIKIDDSVLQRYASSFGRKLAQQFEQLKSERR